jgi:hypothetical protein
MAASVFLSTKSGWDGRRGIYFWDIHSKNWPNGLALSVLNNG